MDSKLPNLTRVDRISLQINESCDSRCRLCDYWTLENPRAMSREVFTQLVHPLLRELSPLENICVTGGEPTLHPLLATIVREIADLTRTLTLITSTSRLEEVFPEIRSFVSSYMVSIDGADRQTYRRTRGIDLFDGALGWVRRLRAETDASIAVSAVIQKDNFDQLEDIVELSLEHGAHHVFLRVPSLTDEGFGRADEVPRRTQNAAGLEDSEIEAVQRQFIAIARRYSREQIPNVLDYGRFVNNLRGGPPPTGLTCDVPFTSMVIDPLGHYLPCFYMPFKADLRDPQQTAELRSKVQLGVLNDPDFRARHCDGCQQYVDRKWNGTELDAEFHRQTLLAAAS